MPPVPPLSAEGFAGKGQCAQKGPTDTIEPRPNACRANHHAETLAAAAAACRQGERAVERVRQHLFAVVSTFKRNV